MIASNTLPEEFWVTINSLQLLLIVYLAIIISKLRERLAKLEGRYDQREKNGYTEGRSR
jgi:hypothetical protein